MAENANKGPWIQTITGKKFFLSAPEPTDISLKDISHSLSLKCRFNGHTKQFYSVAQHSVLVAAEVLARGGSRADAFCGLMHDATEAYMPDIAAPIKREFPELENFEDKIWQAVVKRFGIDTSNYELVKECDLAILMLEKRYCLRHTALQWDTNFPDTSKQTIENLLLPTAAERAFVEMFNTLCNKNDKIEDIQLHVCMVRLEEFCND